MSISNKFANTDSRLKNLTNALFIDANDDIVMRTSAEISLSNVSLSSIVNVGNFPTTQTISGNVGILGNVSVTQSTSPWVVSGNVNASIAGDGFNSNITFQTGLVDAFGRLRVSNPETIFDSSLASERKNDFSSNLSGSGSVTFNTNANVRELRVTNANGDQVIRESRRIFAYQPGKSLLFMNSFRFATAHANVRQRIGNFSPYNGVYFEQTGTTLAFVIRSNSSGVVTEERITQANWNGDRLDGNGGATNLSGLELNMAATQLQWADVEWLGVGTVRCGFILDGKFILCHSFHHANDPTYTTTYMGTATLPVRVEITNTGTTDGARLLQQICHTVISEGGYRPRVETYTAGTDITVKRLTTAGTYYPVVSLRIDPTRIYESVAKLCQVDVLSPTVNYYRWVILRGTTLVNANWQLDSTKIQTDTSATTYTDGTEIQSGFASSRETTIMLAEDLESWLGHFANGEPEIFTLALAATSNNADVLAQLGWQEVY